MKSKMVAVAEETGGATITATPSSAMSRTKTSSRRRSATGVNEAENLQKVSTEIACSRVSSSAKAGEDASTPFSRTLQERATTTNSKKRKTARKIAMNTKSQLQSSAVKSSAETPHLVQENQAIKRQKLEGGRTRQILQIKPQVLPHKSKSGLTMDNTSISSNTSKMHNDDRQIQMTPKHTLIKPMENPWKPHLTEPKTPVFQTSMRARPPKKSSVELELEELEKIPEFKARPLNKKIFESKGDIGVFCNAKKQVTEPKEFHFATHERIPPPAMAALFDFDKLSLMADRKRKRKPIPRNTVPKPFHLHTEERGAEKGKKHFMELQNKQLEEEIARIPKANPYPHTTDYPQVPPKPESKQCTKAEQFELESLVRHEEEMQRQMEEQLMVKKEEIEMRMFKAQAILKEDSIPVADKVRKPLTQVQEFNLHADNRAAIRAQFDEKVKDKEMVYKGFREESEATRMVEEEKALKQLRRTMVTHARPAPKFDHPFCPQKYAKDTTNPKSPNLHVARRKERPKIIYSDTVLSSPAARMR